MGLVAALRRRVRRPRIDPKQDAERATLEDERERIKLSQRAGGFGPSTLPPTPENLDPERWQ
jgi:hypothetical protein